MGSGTIATAMKQIHFAFLTVTLALFLLFTLTMSGHLFSPDGEILYRTAESLYEGKAGAISPISVTGTISMAMPASTQSSRFWQESSP